MKLETENKLLLCELIGYLLTKIVHNEQEFKNWGQPFLESIFYSQFGTEEGPILLLEAQKNLNPVFCSNSSILFESETIDFNDFVYISSFEEKLLDSLHFFSSCSEDQTNELLNDYFRCFYSYINNKNHYDSRARLIANKICRLLSSSAHKFLEMEQKYQSTELSIQDDHAKEENSFYSSFQKISSAIPRDSLVVSYRLWRVAFIAAGGGAMVGMASFMAAPAIVASVVPLLTTVSTFTQYSLSIDTFLMYVGYLNFPILPALFGSYGANLATTKMLKRTAELNQFDLIPLHIKNIEPSVSLNKFLPVFILVCGHIEEKIDPRELWGGNGSVLMIDDEIRLDSEGKIKEDVSFIPRIEHEIHTICDAMEKVIHSSNVLASKSNDWEELKVSYQGWWRDLVPYGDEFVLRWESNLLNQLNENFFSLLKGKIYGEIYGKVMSNLWQMTPLYSLKNSLGLPKLALSKIKDLDDAWALAIDRSIQAGKLLAMTLLKQKKESSDFRPINLVGYGMGARLIYHCLETLVNNIEDQEHVKGIIDNVVFIGAPVSANRSQWIKIRNIVTNRLINCYSRYDWILALFYRSRSYDIFIAGLHPIIIKPSSTNNLHSLNIDPKLPIIQSSEVKSSSDSTNHEEVTLEINFTSMENSLLQSDNSLDVLAKYDNMLMQLDKIHDIENFDVTDLVYYQGDYPKVLPSIINRIQLSSL